MQASTQVRPDTKTAWLSEVKHVLREITWRPNVYPLLNGLAIILEAFSPSRIRTCSHTGIADGSFRITIATQVLLMSVLIWPGFIDSSSETIKGGAIDTMDVDGLRRRR